MKLPFFKKKNTDAAQREKIEKRLYTVKSREKNENVNSDTKKLVKGLFEGDG